MEAQTLHSNVFMLESVLSSRPHAIPHFPPFLPFLTIRSHQIGHPAVCVLYKLPPSLH